MIKRIVIHGGGYVGLTAAMHYARAGWQVVIYDVSKEVVSAINKGQPRAEAFLAYMAEGIQELLRTGKLEATSNFKNVIDIPVHSIAVPTERAGVPYDNYVWDCLVRLVKDCIVKQPLFLIESTLTPGFVDRFLDQVVPNRSKVPLTYRDLHGESFNLAVCPRRDWFADREKNIHTLPRVIGGVSPEATRKAVEVVSTVSPRIERTDYRTAELVKAIENARLHIDVVFAHQLAYSLPEHNIAEAVRLSGSHWRLCPLYLGFGTGGRCVPLGTEYLIKAVENQTAVGYLSIANEASKFDITQRHIIANLALKNCPSGGRIGILGAAYRPDFKDAGRSPGVDVANLIHEKQLNKLTISLYDDLFARSELQKMLAFENQAHKISIEQNDVLLISVVHSSFQPSAFCDLLAENSSIKCIIDATGVLKEQRKRLMSRGIEHIVVGEPGWKN